MNYLLLDIGAQGSLISSCSVNQSSTSVICFELSNGGGLSVIDLSSWIIEIVLHYQMESRREGIIELLRLVREHFMGE